MTKLKLKWFGIGFLSALFLYLVIWLNTPSHEAEWVELCQEHTREVERLSAKVNELCEKIQGMEE